MFERYQLFTIHVNPYTKSSLINELNDLWEHGALTYGALKKENIQLHATILLTINDLPAYGNLSEWATYETLTYLVCQMYIHYCILKKECKCSFLGQWRILPYDDSWRKQNHLMTNKNYGHILKPYRVTKSCINWII